MRKKLRISTLLVCFALSIGAWASAPKYVFYFIGDGMGLGHVMAAETYNRMVLGNKDHIMMAQFPVVSVATSYSFDNPITDSAAAGTALSTGYKTRNGMLGQNPDTVNVQSIAKDFKDHGYGVAIATTVPIDDATPAAYYAHEPNRGMFYEIGKDMAASGYDMFVGSILRGLKDKATGKDTDLIPTIKKAGYTIAEGEEAYEKNKHSKKILLLNKPNGYEHVGFTIDSLPGNLSLPFITKACIEHELMVSPDRFFMMIEGGNIDWAAHANDGGAVIKEILNFNEGIKIAYDFYLKHPDETLILVTADHNTGGMTVGVGGGPRKVNLKNIDYQRISISRFSNYCNDMVKSGKSMTWEEMKDFLKSNLGLYGAIQPSVEQDKSLQAKFEATFTKHEGEDVKTLYSTFNSFIAEVYNVLDHQTGIGWTTKSHCGNFTPVYAIGVGAEKFSNLNNNTDLPAKIREIAGLK